MMTWFYILLALIAAVMVASGAITYRWGLADGENRERARQAEKVIRHRELDRAAAARRQERDGFAPWVTWSAHTAPQRQLSLLADPDSGPYLTRAQVPAPRHAATAPRAVVIPDDASELFR